MTLLSKKCINKIIALLLIISSVNNFFAMAKDYLPSVGSSDLCINERINNQLVDVQRNFSSGVNGQLDNANCTTDVGEKNFLPDEVLLLQIRGVRIMEMLRWMKELSGRNDHFIGRCFGVAKRLKFVLPIIIFKLGIIITILVFLSVFSLKSLAIGVLLLVLNFGGFIGKLLSLKSVKYDKSNTHDPEIYIPIPTHSNPPPHHHKSSPTPQQIHFHIHNKQPLPEHEFGKNHGNHDLGSSLSAAEHAQIGTDDYEPYASGSATSPYRFYKREYFNSNPPTAWANRVSLGIASSTTEAEKRELLQLYKRLGFDISRYLRHMKAQGLKR